MVNNYNLTKIFKVLKLNEVLWSAPEGKQHLGPVQDLSLIPFFGWFVCFNKETIHARQKLNFHPVRGAALKAGREGWVIRSHVPAKGARKQHPLGPPEEGELEKLHGTARYPLAPLLMGQSLPDLSHGFRSCPGCRNSKSYKYFSRKAGVLLCNPHLGIWIYLQSWVNKSWALQPS